MSSDLRFATRRPVLFAAFVTLIFIGSLLVVVMVQKTVTPPLAQETIGAAGRAVMGTCALVWLVRLGWRPWLAGSSSAVSWLLVVPPLAYVLLVYPLLFSGTYRLPAQDASLLAMVAANGLMAGAMEELIFRGLVLGSLLNRWGIAGRGLWRSLVVSSLLFSIPHALNAFAGADPLRTASQVIWAFLFGLAFGALTVAGGSLWPVAVLHGVSNAFIHANRYGQEGATNPVTAALLALAALPLVWYAWLAIRRIKGLRPGPSPAT